MWGSSIEHIFKDYVLFDKMYFNEKTNNVDFLEKYKLDKEKFKLIKINHNKSEKYLTEFTQDCLNFINKIHKDDFENFNYDIITDIKDIHLVF